MAITKVINDAVDLNQTSDYSGLRLPVGTTGNVVESFTTDYLVVGGGGSGSLQGAGGAGGLRTSYNNSTTTTNTLSFPSGKTAIATYMLDGNATDVSGNYNGTETNITYNTGQYGGAAVFNGSSSKITVEDSSDNAFGFANMTGSISVWVNPAVLGTQMGIAAKRDQGSPGNRQWIFRKYSDDKINFYAYQTDSNSQVVISTSTIPKNSWTHVVVTLTTSEMKIYLNGVLDKTTATSYTTIQNDGADLTIGVQGANASSNYWNGSIDEVRIYNSALSSTDVTNVYNNEVQANSGGGTAAEPSLTLSAGTAYDVTIGAGGIDTYASGGSSESGANSIFSTITSTGGGGAGATSGGAAAASGKNGGSGGGAGSNTGGSPGNGTLGQGYIGGTALFYGGSYAGGGGGGALGSGGNTTSNTVAGNGGAQLNLAITGNSVGYAGGGGGSLYGTGTVGTNDSSAGAAAPSGSSSANGESAPFNLGGGGGGANHITGTTNITGGAGGSGVVILRYPTASISSFTTTGTLNTPSATDTVADTAYPVANTAYYKLDNSAIDLSGSTGKFDQAGVFNSSSNSSINTNFINNLSAASFSFWIKVPSSQSTLSTRLLSSVSANPLKAGQWSFIYNGSGSVQFQLITNGGSVNNLSNVSFSLDTWQHFVFTYDNSNTTGKVYLNGSLATSSSIGNVTETDNTTPLHIGFYPRGGTYDSDSSYDQVRIYDTALSSTDVTALYNETVSTTGQLNFPSGQTAIATYELNGNANGILTTTDLSTVNYPAGAGCIALYEMNGTADDTSGVYNGTPSNIDYNFGAFGQAAVFNGSSSYIDLGTSLLGSRSAFSVSAWVNFDNLNTQNFIFYNSESGTGGNLGFYDFGNGNIYFQPDASTSANRGYVSNSGIYTTSEWVHIVMVFDGSATSNSNRLKAYIQGQPITLTYDGTIPSSSGTSTANSWIGGRASTKFSGSIDQVRIYDAALTSSQVTTLARGIGTSYSGADTNVLYAYNGTPTNVTYGNGRFNEAANFNGSSSKLIVPNSTSIAQQNNYTFSAWFKTDTTGVMQTIYAFNSPSTYQSAIFIHSSGTNNIRIFSAGSNYYSSNNVYTNNQWYHIAVTKSSANGIVAYLDGNVIINEPTATANNTQASAGDNRIGGYKTSAESLWFDGSIDQVRIFSTALTSDQVTELYNEHYQTQFTDGSDTAIVFTEGTGTVTFSGVDPAPPQGALRTNTSYSEDGSGSVIEHYNGTGWKYFDAIKYCTTNTLNFPSGAGCIASYNLNNNVDDIGNTYNGINSNVTFTASGEFGAAAVFNGSNSYINLNHNTNYNNFSISAWINPSAITSTHPIVGKWWDGSNRSFQFWLTSSGVGVDIAYTDSNADHVFYNTNVGALSTNKWYFVCVTWENGVGLTLTVDADTQTHSIAKNIRTNTSNWFIGLEDSRGNKAFNGFIDQVRIFNDSLTSDEVTQLYNNEIACS